MMQLYFAATSAYVRKVMVCATVLGLADEIEPLDSAAHPIERDERIATFNPLAKVPALRTESGLCLYDSRVICEYLNARAARLLRTAATCAGAAWQDRRWAMG